MQITPMSAADSSSATQSSAAEDSQTSSSTGFWALFANAQYPEPSWSSKTAPAAAPGTTGMEALFTTSTAPVAPLEDVAEWIKEGKLYDSSTV